MYSLVFLLISTPFFLSLVFYCLWLIDSSCPRGVFFCDIPRAVHCMHIDPASFHLSSPPSLSLDLSGVTEASGVKEASGMTEDTKGEDTGRGSDGDEGDDDDDGATEGK